MEQCAARQTRWFLFFWVGICRAGMTLTFQAARCHVLNEGDVSFQDKRSTVRSRAAPPIPPAGEIVCDVFYVACLDKYLSYFVGSRITSSMA